VETTPKASGCFMGGTRAVREEPGKQKPRSALFASRQRDCGRGNSPQAAPKQKRGGKGSTASVHSVEVRAKRGTVVRQKT
jgi:hypothetical protein